MKAKLILSIVGLIKYETEFFLPEYSNLNFQDRTELREKFIKGQIAIIKDMYYKQILKHKSYFIQLKINSTKVEFCKED
jgi:ribosomal protein L10